MTLEDQIKRMKKTNRIYLSKGNTVLHFRLVFFFLLIPMLNLYEVINASIYGLTLTQRQLEIQRFSIPLVLGALLVFYLFYDLLTFKKIKATISEKDFKKKCTDLCIENGWILTLLNPNGMIAYEGFEKEGQKIIVLRKEHRILVNSLFDIQNQRSGLWPSLNKKHLQLVEEKMRNSKPSENSNPIQKN